MKKIAVLTSGGDAPGMNACIRAVVKTALTKGLEVCGVEQGYQGMIDDEIYPLVKDNVKFILNMGGTFLRSARCDEFRTPEGRKKAYENLKRHGIDGVVCIGGDGTFQGASIFNKEYDIPFIGIPGTIDNDLVGTDFTIGYDTALNTVVDAVDKIRDTADSHNRLFFVEVMGKDAGFIALRSGIGVGAKAILIPETKTYVEELIGKLDRAKKKNIGSVIIIVAEGDETGGAVSAADKVKQKFTQYDTKVTILGHIQRGGKPSAADRVLASRLGFYAVNALLEGKTNLMVGIVNKELAYTPFESAIKHHDKINHQLLELAEVLAL